MNDKVVVHHWSRFSADSGGFEEEKCSGGKKEQHRPPSEKLLDNKPTQLVLTAESRFLTFSSDSDSHFAGGFFFIFVGDRNREAVVVVEH